MRKWILAAAGVIAFGLSGAVAQTFPSRNITMVIPFSAGGPTDTVGRLIAEAMSKSLGQTVIVENVVGAGGTRGPAQVAKANPDGYTLLLHHVGMSTAPALYRKLPFNSVTGFETIGLIANAPMSLITTSHIKSGKVKAYGITTMMRVKSLAGLPTLNEAGLKGFEVAVWHGLYAPKDTPGDVTAKLTAALQVARKDEKMIERFAALGTEPVAQAEAMPAAHKKKLEAEIVKWRPLIQAAGQFAD